MTSILRSAPTNNIFDLLREDNSDKKPEPAQDTKAKPVERVPLGSQKKGAGPNKGQSPKLQQQQQQSSNQGGQNKQQKGNSNKPPRQQRPRFQNQGQQGGFQNQGRNDGFQIQGQSSYQGGSPSFDRDSNRGPRNRQQRGPKPDRRGGRQFDRRSGDGRDPNEVRKGGVGKGGYSTGKFQDEVDIETEWDNDDSQPVGPAKVDTVTGDNKAPDTTPAGTDDKQAKEEEKLTEAELKEKAEKEKEAKQKLYDEFEKEQARKKEELQKLLESSGKKAPPRAAGEADWSNYKKLENTQAKPQDAEQKKKKPEGEVEKNARKGEKAVALNEIFYVKTQPRGDRRGRGRGPYRGQGDRRDNQQQQQQQTEGGEGEKQQQQPSEERKGHPNQNRPPRNQGYRGGQSPQTGPRRNKQNRGQKEFDATDESMFPSLGSQ